MNPADFALWVYLSRTPLLWLTLTLIVYALVDAVSQRLHRHPLANPVLHSMWIIGVILAWTHTAYKVYFDGAQFIHFLLGPATVALAVPLYENRKIVVRALLPMMAALFTGSIIASVSAILVAKWLGTPQAVLISLAPKSVTAGVAMAISQSMGGDPALTAVMVISTGILGAILVTPMMDFLRIRDYRARGFAAGLAAHGIGTARAFQVNPVAGTFAGVAIGLNALLTSIIAPLVIKWLIH